MKTRALALVFLFLSACSAEIDVQSDPFSQTVPVTSLLEPVYAEVAIDLPEETQSIEVTVNTVSATLAVVNPSKSLTLQTGVRLSFEGKAEPGTATAYTNANLPAYYSKAAELIAPRNFAPGSSTPLTIENPALVQAVTKKRVWLIVSNTVTRTSGLPTESFPVNIRLENIVFHATVTKAFPGLGGALEVGGL
jgi:hypothetical protein